MLYECYRSDVTIEPQTAVNVANLLDGTKPKDKQVLGTMWYETRGQLDSYVITNFTEAYDDTAGVGVIKSGSSPSQKNRVVYKIYDTSGICLSAATLVFKTCYDVQDECCSQQKQKSCQGQGISLSKPRKNLGCSKLQFTRYPQAEPFPLCADYHSCT
ncbi:hypothetical protein HPB49_016012 [Dermacentor silvarum]|uniref:Uncharacterized protein n=1 Tax=Dermacentor silvarum TaxID=543639 RepID=A0ACB8CLM0_DERSI|nr:hypothetical protein HPB49_016012 [Dermacentor silvarum]